MLTLTANSVNAQPNFTNCSYVSKKTNAFVEYVRNASKLVKDNQVTDTLLSTVNTKMKALESELRAMENRTYNYSDEPDLINYGLSRCYTAYFSFLLRLHEEKLVGEIVEKNDAYFTFVNGR